jgi:ABC-type glycerol-3-phosphate transport system substrate-binding protein
MKGPFFCFPGFPFRVAGFKAKAFAGFLVFCLIPGGLSLLSCQNGGRTATLWTDRSDFAIYADYFNSVQDLYKVEVRYFDSLARELTVASSYPDIVAGSWLKSADTRSLFLPLENFFKNRSLSAEDFYPRLLALGKIEDRQYLLPVAFNIPALVFAREKGNLLSSPFTIGLEEIKELGGEFNAEGNGTYTRMGFSPAWDDEFLLIAARLFNIDFREAAPLSWNTPALDGAVDYLRTWIDQANGSIRQLEDFTFKYFFDPPAKLVLSGRILFTYMESDEFFTLAEDRRSSLDFRWIAERNSIPVQEDAVYYGICKRGPSRKAAGAFTAWFFQAETQRRLLELSRDKRMNESFFGIGGGFSALRSVTEQIFPRFYPGLLGHMPPEEFLSPPSVLPRNWDSLKDRVILPYLQDAIRSGNRGFSLERRIGDWSRFYRE